MKVFKHNTSLDGVIEFGSTYIRTTAPHDTLILTGLQQCPICDVGYSDGSCNNMQVEFLLITQTDRYIRKACANKQFIGAVSEGFSRVEG